LADEPVILVVDDEEDILSLIAYNLQQDGYRPLLARNGRDALAIAEAATPDLMVLDIMMPEMDGIDVCRTVRRHARLSGLPIIFLTARSGDSDHVHGLDVGADIYLAKPVAMPVLLSQIRALLRRSEAQSERPVIRVDGLVVDRERYLVTVQVDGQDIPLRLPRKEFELLYFLAASPGRVFTRDELLDQVWGADVFVVDRTIDVHVRKIREKIGADYIETVKGVGYRFKE
jgi:two-component system alkaline phosphatase synthesis response regulator PhoP